MSEQPATIAREAKTLHQSLKELLKVNEPFDKEVDFQRKNLRRHYLSLLLVHPNAKEAKDAENHLWMQTSYAFIASYKQRIGVLDRLIQNNRQQQNQQQQSGGQRGSNHGVVEYRKLLQRFRSFLSDEEKFWTQLVLRLRRLFDLREAQPSLVALGLLAENDDGPSASNIAIASSTVDAGEVRDGVVHITNANGRNHFQFPPEDLSISFPPTSSEDKSTKMAILSKALICLGDIARYRELYSESGGRPRAGQEEGSSRRGRNRRGSANETSPKARSYDKAQQCYEQARSLVPDEGNPSHQLAILASYQKDSFTSLIHYYRALCVRQPYDTAAENLGTVLAKALDQWRQKNRRDRDKNGPDDAQLVAKARSDLLRERIVVLHAVWRLGMEKGVLKMQSIAPKLPEKIFLEFRSLVGERHLTTDMISNIIVLSQGAIWKHRMIRDTTSTRRQEAPPPPPETSTLVEWEILRHLLDLHTALLEVGSEELKDPPAMEDDLAQRISATFRRTLPALRIASKWLRANCRYLSLDPEFAAFQKAESAKGVEAAKSSSVKIGVKSVHTIKFWNEYAQFIRVLSQAFPTDKLPALNVPLEEDTEMRGWLPLRGLMGDRTLAGDKPHSAEQVHPNVEQLMRISDLLSDATDLASMENSPLCVENGHVVFDTRMIVKPQPASIQAQDSGSGPAETTVQEQQLLTAIRDTKMELHPKPADEDQMTEFTSRTDEDVVRDAFKFLNNSDTADDEEDEEIVWDPRASMSPTLSPSLQATPITPVRPMLSPKTSPRSPIQYHSTSKAVPPPLSSKPMNITTAQDLLNNVMGGSFTKNLSTHQPLAAQNDSAPPPALLFGAELASRQSHSIWRASMDEQPTLRFSGNGHVPNQTPAPYSPARSHFSPQDGPQHSIWSSGPSQPQNSQYHPSLGLSSGFTSPPGSIAPGLSQGLPPGSIHHRMYPSPSSLHSQPYASAPAPISPAHYYGHDQLGHASNFGPPNQQNPTYGNGNGSLNGGYLPSSANPPPFPTTYNKLRGNAPSSIGNGRPSNVPYHARQMSTHDPRSISMGVAGGNQSYLSAPHGWGNAG